MCRPGPSAWLPLSFSLGLIRVFLEGLTHYGEEVQARIEEAFPDGDVHAPGYLR